MSLDFRALADAVFVSLQPTFPFLVHSAASAGTFATCLGATQVLAYYCKVSCATPFLGPTIGVLGVGFASCAAGQASVQCQRYYSGRPLKLRPTLRKEDLIIDACAGLLLFKAFGGRFRTVLPSDLFAPGALALESVRAKGPQYAGSASKAQLVRHFRRDGCHHCGRRLGEVIGDHMPPSRHVYGSKSDLLTQAKIHWSKSMGSFGSKATKAPAQKVQEVVKKIGRNQLAEITSTIKKALDPQYTAPLQRYYPQCKRCSNKQASAVQRNRRTLILHWRGPLIPIFSSVVVGLRHYSFDGPTLPPKPSSNGHSKHSQHWNDRPDAFGLHSLLRLPYKGLDSLGGLMERQAQNLQREAFGSKSGISRLALDILSS